MKFSKEVVVGIVGAIVLFLVLLTFNYLNRKNVFSTNLMITAKFKDIEFIRKGNPVYIKGRNYGRVTAIYKKGNDIFLDMDIEAGAQIPPTAKAVVMDASLLGGRLVSIVYEGLCIEDCLVSGAIIPGEYSNLQTRIAASAGPILKSVGGVIDTLMGENGMQAMLDNAYASAKGLAETTNGLNRKFGGMAKTLPTDIKDFNQLLIDLQRSSTLTGAIGEGAVASQADSLIATLASLSDEDIDVMVKILYTMNEQAKNLPDLVKKGAPIIEKVDQQVAQLDKKVAAYLPGSEGMIPKLLYDAASKDSLQYNIQNIDSILQDIRLHPERYLAL